jgi:conjugative relaxase-like TrwC/TraI family protein
MLTIRAMSDGRGYSSRHLEHGDYYDEGERLIGHWQGRGAALLGLSGEIKPEHFESLRQGLDPRTGEFLRQRKSADRMMPDGTIQSHGRNLYDFTISAPKSVSVMAALDDDVYCRIAALKLHQASPEERSTLFRYNPDEPLHLPFPSKPKKLKNNSSL